jgi:hypothetical protein
MSDQPQRPPTADELLANPSVMQAMDQAWVDSKPDELGVRHEEGGWIYMNVSTVT